MKSLVPEGDADFLRCLNKLTVAVHEMKGTHGILNGHGDDFIVLKRHRITELAFLDEVDGLGSAAHASSRSR